MKCKINPSWIKLEMEHTNNKEYAKKIVNDHIGEFGCEYYPNLIRLERKLSRK